MKRAVTVMAMILFCGGGALHAQGANPISTQLKGQWANIRDLLVKMADGMPEEGYRFKPTPEMEDFGQRMAHVVTFNMRGCSGVKGEQKPLMFSMPPTKAEVSAAMKQTNDECDGVFNTLSDADLAENDQSRARGAAIRVRRSRGIGARALAGTLRLLRGVSTVEEAGSSVKRS